MKKQVWVDFSFKNIENENASLRVVPVYWKAIEGAREALPAGIVLGTNEMDFMGSFTVSPLSVDKKCRITHQWLAQYGNSFLSVQVD